MRFINDDGVVFIQKPIIRHLGQQDPVGHQANNRVVIAGFVKAHLKTHGFAQWLAQLLGNPLRHTTRRQSTRLSMANQTTNTPTRQHRQLRQLGGFAGASLTCNNNHLVVTNRRNQSLCRLAHR